MSHPYSLGMPLFWRLFLANAATLGAAFSLLAAGAPQLVGAHGLGTLLLGAAALLLINAAVIGQSLAGLAELQHVIDSPSERILSLPAGSAIEVKQLATAFAAMRQRLANERVLRARAALRAQEQERRTLARDLHDEVGQNLTFLLLRLNRISEQAPPETAADLETVAETARATLDQVRSLSRQLRPGVLDDLGLRPALSALVDEIRPIVPHATLRCPSGLERVPERDLVVYRVVQEALTNVARHAQALSVSVTVAVEGTQLVVTVDDDGNGSSGTEGTGTGSMRERAALVGGTFSRTSVPGRGTHIRLQVPMTLPNDSGTELSHPIPTIGLVPVTPASHPQG